MNSHIFSKIVHSPTANEVMWQIESLILEGVLRVGERLPGERDLAAQMEVSRPVLRNALRSLEERGLLVTRHGGGTYVADVIGQVFTNPMIELIATHGQATLDYLEYRREIEGVAAELAARRATEDDKALLTDIMERMDTAHQKDNFEEEAEIDVELHNAIGECAHNVILLHTLRSCYRLLSDGVFYNRSMIYAFPGARTQLLDQHKAIYKAVMDGNPAAAREAAENHMEFVEKSFAEAEQIGNRERVSRLRLRQRSAQPGGDALSRKREIDER
jgi:GntR family transcriptional repressor for pyruvate dehydrogenase complex